MVCCGQLLSVILPPGLSDTDRSALIQDLVNQCAVRQAFCGLGGGPPPQLPGNPNNPVSILYYNHPKSCSSKCPDGSLNTYTVPAGTFAASAQADADAQAAAFACNQAGARKMCIGSLPGECCANAPFSAVVTVTGGVGQVLKSISSGFLPFGLGFNPANGLISGTPTTPGFYTFTIMATEAGGTFVGKTFSICVVGISPQNPILPSSPLNTPYSQALTEPSGCSQNALAWAVVAGSLPPGLSINSSTGVISGTPTTPGNYLFTVQVQDGVPAGQVGFEYWEMEETGNVDRLGSIHALNLSSVGNPISSGAGIIGQGAVFSSISALLNDELYNHWTPLAYTAGNPVSLSFWAKHNSVAGTLSNIYFGPGSGPGPSVPTNGRLRVLFTLLGGVNTWFFDGYEGDGTRDILFTKSPVSAGVWHHGVITYDPAGPSFKAYFDGVLVNTTVLSTPWVGDPQGFLDLVHAGLTDSITFDEVYVNMNHLLSAAEVTTLYNGGAGSRPTGL
jgi:hypothetical protein